MCVGHPYFHAHTCSWAIAHGRRMRCSLAMRVVSVLIASLLTHSRCPAVVVSSSWNLFLLCRHTPLASDRGRKLRPSDTLHPLSLTQSVMDMDNTPGFWGLPMTRCSTSVLALSSAGTAQWIDTSCQPTEIAKPLKPDAPIVIL